MNGSGGSGRRPVLRWAVRLYRREWRQQMIVLSLLTVAVAAAVGGCAVVVNAASASTDAFGSGGSLVRLDASDPAAAQRSIDAVRARFGTIDLIAHTTTDEPGSIQPLDVRAQDPNGPYGKPLLRLRAGHFPATAGEVALTSGAATAFATTIGDTVEIAGAPVVVVGTVENPAALDDEFALVAPGALPTPTSYVLLIDAQGRGDSQTVGQVDGPGFGIETRGSNEQAVAAMVLIAATLALALVGLVAAAGFVVVAQRRQRQLGLLAAIGATDRHVRLVMIGNGVIVGTIAAAGGAVLGVAGWIAAAPVVESAANHRLDRFDLPWMLIIAVLLVAVSMATIAAWWPARTASRLPVMAALSGRPQRPKPVHRSLIVAVGLCSVGMGSIAVAQPTSDHVRPLVLIAGVVAVVLGTVFAAPAAVRVLGTFARRLPFAPRLALRDLARYQARAAAALAAITLGLGIAVGIVGVASASEPRASEGNLSGNELLVLVGDPRSATDPSLTAAEVADLDERAARVVDALGDGSSAVPLDVAFAPRPTADTNVIEPLGALLTRGEHSWEMTGYPYVATPELLALYGIDPASIDDTTDLVTERTDPLIIMDMSARPDSGEQPATIRQHVGLPAYGSAPNTLITTSAMTRNGWMPARAGWIVESARPLTSAQIAAARAAAGSVGLAIEVRHKESGIAAARTGATLVGALLAMAIVAMAIGLIRAESTRDVRTLTATGAASGTRRALTASTAAALSILGVVLGMGGAYVALIAAFHSDLAKLTPVPIAHLAALAFGLPLASTAAGWLLAGREPRTFSRQGLE